MWGRETASIETPDWILPGVTHEAGEPEGAEAGDTVAEAGRAAVTPPGHHGQESFK